MAFSIHYSLSERSQMASIGQKYLGLGSLLQNIEQVLNVDGVYLPDWGEVCSQYLIFLLWEF